MTQDSNQAPPARQLFSPLVQNITWTLLGTGIPLLVAIFAIPKLLDGIGTARFGILSLAWIVVGYFGLFDFGLGRAITQQISQRIGTKEYYEVPSIVWIGMSLICLLGLVAAIGIWAVAPSIAKAKLSVPEAMTDEVLATLYILALSIPFTVFATGLRGVLEAHQRFDVINIVRVPLNTLSYLVPLWILPYSHHLTALVASLVAIRVIMCGVYSVVCVVLYPDLFRPTRFRYNHLRSLLSFGGWMTLSNTVGPLLLYCGRFFLAVFISAEAVAYFSTPFDMIVNLLIIPGIFVTVYFPLFASRASDREAARILYKHAMIYTLVTMLPLSLTAFVFAKPTLSWWINPDFAEHSFRVAQLLSLGILINSFGLVVQALLQAIGRPDLTAKLHVLELVLYLPYLWWLVSHFGVDGAAVAWVIRVSLSTFALLLLVKAWQSGIFQSTR